MNLIILSDFHPNQKLGGGGAIAYELHKIALRKGLCSNFWYTGHSGPNNSNERAFTAKNYNNKLFSYMSQMFGNMVSLKILLQIYKSRPDIVWIHQIGNLISFAIILFLRISRVPTIVTLHDYLLICPTKVAVINPDNIDLTCKENLLIGNRLHDRLRRRLLTWYVSFANSIFAVSDLQQQVLSKFNVSCTAVIPNGVSKCTHNLQDFTPNKKVLNVLFAGRFHRKGLEYLIEGLKSSHSDWHLNLAGDTELLEYANMKLPAEKFTMHGKLSRSQLHDLLHNMQLVSVISQYFDPYPTIGLEAIRHGSVFFTTNTSGISFLLRNTEPQLILKVGEVPDLDKLYDLGTNTSFNTSALDQVIPLQTTVFEQYLNVISKILLNKNTI